MIIPAQFDLIISMDYSPDALAWVDLYDNRCLGWNVDDATPPGHEAIPVIVGQLPTDRSKDTLPVLSPQWVENTEDAIIVPDLWRGSVFDFFTWLATNNGANRKLRAKFVLNNPNAGTWSNWAARNSNLVR